MQYSSTGVTLFNQIYAIIAFFYMCMVEQKWIQMQVLIFHE